MYLHWLMFSLGSVGWVSAAGNCSYMMLVEHLGLDKNDFQMTSLRPVHDWTTPTRVYVDLYVSSITDVDQKAQSLSTQVTVESGWINEFTRWNPKDFCGITSFSFPKDMIWNPDIGIIESIKTEFATKESPYVEMLHMGIIASSDILSLTTACKMDLHKFPFDVQSCTLTLQSTMLAIGELTINPYSDATFLTVNSKRSFQTQGEWELLSINMTKTNNSAFGNLQDQLKYEITIKRRPLLYIINFMLPVFYFLVLDLASFFVDASGGEKLSFKVTLLLAISVLLLILNDTLPSTAKNMPLIGIYCIVIFTLIGISILETILVNFLMAKGAGTISAVPVKTTTNAADKDDDLNCPPDTIIDRNEDQSCTLDHLRQILMKFKTATHQNQESTCLCWTRVAEIIDMTFLFLYIIIVIVFLSLLAKAWFP